MKKYSIFLYLLFAIFSVCGFILYFVYNLGGYAIFAATVAVVSLVTGVVLQLRYSSPKIAYESTVQNILNTFDSILVRSSTVPNLEGRNIVPVMSMDDMVDAQLEIRKPICYLKQTESCSFVLLDDKEAYVYIEKISDEVSSPVEIAIHDLEIKNKNRDDMDSEMLRDIDKTTVVKLSNQKSYRVSPIRKTKKEVKDVEMLDQTTTIPTVRNRKKQDVELLDRTTTIPVVKKNKHTDVELLDQTRTIPVVKNNKKKQDVEVLDQTTTIPVIKSKKKSFLEHTQVIEQLDDSIEEDSSVRMDEVETL